MKLRILSLAALFTVLALLSSTALVYASAPSEPNMVGSQWAVYEETTLPNGGLNFYPATHAITVPTGGVEFQMPDATGSSPTYVNYIMDTFTTSLATSNVLIATINVVSSSTTIFEGDAFGGENVVTPAFVRLFFQSNLPSSNTSSCVGIGSNVNNYWWANPTDGSQGSYTFVTGGSGGQLTLSVPLNPADWSNICGQYGSSSQAGFAAAIQNIKEVGLSFGSGNFFASGVGVDGSATFQLVSFTIS